MKLQKLMLSVLSLALCLAANSQASHAQSERGGKTYQQMSLSERSEFVAARAQSIGRYTKRIGSGDRGLGDRDLREVVVRGTVQAPGLIAAFKARNVSPLIGLYLPWIESEYVNIQTPNSMGSIGMFQFIPQTGEG